MWQSSRAEALSTLLITECTAYSQFDSMVDPPSQMLGEEILQVVTQHATNMNSVNVATAWHRLAKLSRSFPTSSYQEMKQKRKIIHDVRMQIMERLLDKFADTFDAIDLSNVGVVMCCP